MAERPHSRTTVLVGWLTVATMVVIATIFLLISSPWNDPHPHLHKKKDRTSTSRTK